MLKYTTSKTNNKEVCMYSFKYKEIFRDCFLMTYGDLPPQDLIDNWLSTDYCDEKCAKLQEWVINKNNHIDGVEGITVLESFMMIAENTVDVGGYKVNKETILKVFSKEHLENIKRYIKDWSFFSDQKKHGFRFGQHVLYRLWGDGYNITYLDMLYCEDDKELEWLLWEVFDEVGV